MKHIVDREQAEKLFNADVHTMTNMFIDKNSHYVHVDFLLKISEGSGEYYGAPNIGELIEWIDKNHPHLSIDRFADGWMVDFVSHGHTTAVELIDALVELAIKISEANNE